jgi:hypothetical protein
MLRILSIDPGINGAAALFVGGSLVPVEPGGVIDLPTVGAEKQREVDVMALRDWMLQMRPDVAVIERVTPMPAIPDPRTGKRREMGATSAFNFGGTFKVLKAIPMLFNIPTELVTPGKWKGFYGLKGGDAGKEQARQRALQMWPMLSSLLSRKKDQDRAEALLIANWHWKVQSGEWRVDPHDVLKNDEGRPIGDGGMRAMNRAIDRMLDISRRVDDDIDDIPE